MFYLCSENKGAVQLRGFNFKNIYLNFQEEAIQKRRDELQKEAEEKRKERAAEREAEKAAAESDEEAEEEEEEEEEEEDIEAVLAEEFEVNEPSWEKTCNLCCQLGLTQTRLYSHRRRLKA